MMIPEIVISFNLRVTDDVVTTIGSFFLNDFGYKNGSLFPSSSNFVDFLHSQDQAFVTYIILLFKA